MNHHIAVVLTIYLMSFRTFCIWLEPDMPEKSLIGFRSSVRPQPIIWSGFST
jgi:hypothetical protein